MSPKQCLHPNCFQISTSKEIYGVLLYYVLPPTVCNFSRFLVHRNNIYSNVKQYETVIYCVWVSLGTVMMTSKFDSTWRKLRCWFKSFRISFIWLKLNILSQGHLFIQTLIGWFLILDATTHKSAALYFHTIMFCKLGPVNQGRVWGLATWLRTIVGCLATSSWILLVNPMLNTIVVLLCAFLQRDWYHSHICKGYSQQLVA